MVVKIEQKPEPKVEQKAEPKTKVEARLDPKPAPKAEPLPEPKPAPVIDSKKVEPRATGSIAHNTPPAREVVVHARPDHRAPPPSAKSQREERLAMREREQRRLRAEFERAERVAAQRRVEQRRAPPPRQAVRYYRAGAREPSVSEVFR